ncbi:hypothetical protein [Rhizobium sp. LC145]|uniref:hypothetical protein n=1 Tax=Rhizobium sp. LC145 TaxID=1120688 RepID=UPI00148595A4|nr:hypothetical protein [Rhizobium sp. LC145]
MDGLLKTLIAGACIVVVAAGGHYLWSEHQASSALAREQAAAARSASAEAERYAARLSCARYMTPELGEAKRKREQCRQGGFISYAEQLDAEAGKTFRP